jgi:hypothetical protein
MSDRMLIITTVPANDLHALLIAIGDAGAGTIGEYTHCTFSSAGTGRFMPSAQANPAVGERLRLNEVDEMRIETSCARADAKAICAAIRAAHPYEEPVIYLIPMIDDRDL